MRYQTWQQRKVDEKKSVRWKPTEAGARGEAVSYVCLGKQALCFLGKALMTSSARGGLCLAAVTPGTLGATAGGAAVVACDYWEQAQQTARLGQSLNAEQGV